MTYLLDTNIVIAVLNKDGEVEEKITGKTIAIASIVLGELYFGAHKSKRSEQNIAKIEAFISSYPVLDCTKLTAKHYGSLKQTLEAKGNLIPENDMWIAALAKHHQLILVTRDEHFKRVDGLTIEQW